MLPRAGRGQRQRRGAQEPRWTACPFPYWGAVQVGGVGARDDKIEDRNAQTVYYDNPKGARAAYTILGGDTIDAPSGARKQTVNGVQLSSPRTRAAAS